MFNVVLGFCNDCGIFGHDDSNCPKPCSNCEGTTHQTPECQAPVCKHKKFNYLKFYIIENISKYCFGKVEVCNYT